MFAVHSFFFFRQQFSNHLLFVDGTFRSLELNFRKNNYTKNVLCGGLMGVKNMGFNAVFRLEIKAFLSLLSIVQMCC